MPSSSAATRVGALTNQSFRPTSLQSIDKYAKEAKLNLWEKPSTDQRV